LKKLFVLWLLCIPAIFLAIMPPRTPVEERIARGELSIPILTAEERGEAYHTPRAVGSFRAVVLLVDFSDQPAKVDTSFFHDLFLGRGVDFKAKYPISTNLKSVQEYYEFVSDGQYQITFDIYGWFRLPETYAYYIGSNTGLGSYPRNAQRMTEDAVDMADSVVDFSKYDNDGDGWVDFLLIVHAGSGAEFEGDKNQIWSHQWTMSTTKTKDGKILYRYCTQPEYWLQKDDMTIGVYVHELGHLLFNLPDLYDIYQNSKGIGYWGLMGSGSWNDSESIFDRGSREVSGYGGAPAELTAWSKYKIGWLKPTEILANEGEYTLTRGTALKYTHPNNPQEYFLIEYKEDNSYNRNMPSCEGLMIYHIDDGYSNNVFPWVPGDDPDLHYHVAIEQKDGLWELERNLNRGTSDDLFFEGDAFSSITLPTSHFYDGRKGLSLIQIVIESDRAVISLNEGTFVYFLMPIPGTEYYDVFIKKDRDALPAVIVSTTGERPAVTRIRESVFRFRIFREQYAFTRVDGTPLKNAPRATDATLFQNLRAVE